MLSARMWLFTPVTGVRDTVGDPVRTIADAVSPGTTSDAARPMSGSSMLRNGVRWERRPIPAHEKPRTIYRHDNLSFQSGIPDFGGPNGPPVDAPTLHRPPPAVRFPVPVPVLRPPPTVRFRRPPSS